MGKATSLVPRAEHTKALRWEHASNWSYRSGRAPRSPGDAKEAVLFAVLANETVAGRHADFGRRLGVPSVSMGEYLVAILAK